MINISNELAQEMTSWRRHMHQNPELAFEIESTASFVASHLRSWGIEVHEGIGKTGVVGVLSKGDATKKTIALRADMDAIPIQEMNEFSYKSTNDKIMHGCGHDGHTAMLLGAAKYLATEGTFDGTVVFIFQPDEENGQGALAMINDGLFEKFPCDEIFGMHNLPGLTAGKIALRSGGIMASETLFEINIAGQGGHASSPHRVNDPVVAATQILASLQTIVSRTLDPLDPSVVSVTEILTDGARNVIPSNITLKGDYRMFSDENVAIVEQRMRDITTGICAAYNMEGSVSISKEFLVTFNQEKQTQAALKAAIALVGEDNVINNCEPKSFSEDFAHLSKMIPGCYIFVGNGCAGQHSLMLHNPKYDFNDDVLKTGASYWCHITTQQLS